MTKETKKRKRYTGIKFTGDIHVEPPENTLGIGVCLCFDGFGPDAGKKVRIAMTWPRIKELRELIAKYADMRATHLERYAKNIRQDAGVTTNTP